jgi:hypothetical protein
VPLDRVHRYVKLCLWPTFMVSYSFSPQVYTQSHDDAVLPRTLHSRLQPSSPFKLPFCASFLDATRCRYPLCALPLHPRMRHNITITIPSHSLFRDVTLCCCPLDTQPEPMWVHIYELCRLWIWTSGVTGHREGAWPGLFICHFISNAIFYQRAGILTHLN